MTNLRTNPTSPAPTPQPESSAGSAARNVPVRTALKAGADDTDTTNTGWLFDWPFRHTFGEPSPG
jgi:hypothetical protein